MVDVDLPPTHMMTTGCWIQLPGAAKAEVARRGLYWIGGLHAACHVLVECIRLFVPSDRQDVDTAHSSPFEGRPKPLMLVFFDAVGGGSGVAEAVFPRLKALVKAAYSLVEHCPCVQGCPRCICSSHCSEYNERLDKAACLIILRWAMQAMGRDVGDKTAS